MKRSELYAAVWNTSMLRLAEAWGYSDTVLRDICVKHGVPVPARGYWPRKRAGQNVPMTPLPEGPDVDIDVGPRTGPDERQEIHELSTLARSAEHSELRATDVAKDDFSVELALLERDAKTMREFKDLQAALAEVGAALATASDVDPVVWSAYMAKLGSHVRRRMPGSSAAAFVIGKLKGGS